jgi:group I intron endonuclease
VGLIYSISNSINGKRYIGKTIKSFKTRWSIHCASKDAYHFHNAIRCYDKSVWSFEIIGEYDNEILSEAEVYWISYYNTFKGNGYNSTEGGEGFNGKHTDEAKRKMSLAKIGKPSPRKGKYHTDEAKRKMGLANIGKPAWNKGIACSEEQKEKLRKLNPVGENLKPIPNDFNKMKSILKTNDKLKKYYACGSNTLTRWKNNSITNTTK